MKINPVFPCPVSGELFPTEEAARANADKINQEKERETQKEAKYLEMADSFRLELTSISDFGRLLNEKIEKLIKKGLPKITVSDFRFNPKILLTHNAPIGQDRCGYTMGEARYAPGFHYNISSKYVKIGNKQFCVKSIVNSEWGWNDTYKPKFGGFRGLKTCGGGGDFDNWGYSAVMFLDDFPLIKEKYDKLAKLKAKQVKFNAADNLLSEQTLEKANKANKILFVEIDELIKKKEEIERKINEKRLELSAKTSDYMKANKPVPALPDYSNEIEQFAAELNLRT
jgi:hypothetical protein